MATRLRRRSRGGQPAAPRPRRLPRRSGPLPSASAGLGRAEGDVALGVIIADGLGRPGSVAAVAEAEESEGVAGEEGENFLAPISDRPGMYG